MSTSTDDCFLKELQLIQTGQLVFCFLVTYRLGYFFQNLTSVN